MKIGNVVSKGEGRLEWRIPEFPTLPVRFDAHFYSPFFDEDGERWCLRVKPNGIVADPRIQILLLRTSCWTGKSISCTVGLKLARHYEETIGMENRGDASYYFFTFNRKRWELVVGGWLPGGQLTVTLLFGGAHASQEDETSMPRDIRREDLERAMDDDSRRDVCQYCGSKGVEKLRSDYKKLLKSEAESDLLVVVSGREFRAHKSILRVRSPVFDAMFEHDTKEKQSGKVVIDDLNPDAFRGFLEYLYTGRVEALSYENVFGVYAAADKYDVQELKSEALEFMQRTLSVESFCDVMALALRHQEQDLLDRAVDFFKDNLPDIIVTVKWQAFMKKNTTAANELLVKALVPKKAK